MTGRGQGRPRLNSAKTGLNDVGIYTEREPLETTMTRSATSLVAFVLLVAAIAAPFAAAASPGAGNVGSQPATFFQSENETAGDATDGTAPGATLAGALGSEESELEGEFDRKSLDVAATRATTIDARADVVADRVLEIDQRLAELEARRAKLEEAHRDGAISGAEYRARMTLLAAQARSLDRLGAQTVVHANGIPADVLAERGITPEQLVDLANRTDDLATYEEDLFGGTYGEEVTFPDPEEPVATPTPIETGDDWGDDPELNDSTFDGFEWNTTSENLTDWNGTELPDLNGTELPDLNGTDLDGLNESLATPDEDWNLTTED